MGARVQSKIIAAKIDISQLYTKYNQAKKTLLVLTTEYRHITLIINALNK